MQKSLTVRKFIPLIVIAIITALFAVAMLMSNAFTASAEGNDSGSHGTPDIELRLDMNGRDATVLDSASGFHDDSTAAVTTNNGKHLSKRRVYAATVFSLYAARPVHSSENFLSDTPSDWSFVRDSWKVDSKSIKVKTAIESGSVSHIDIMSLAKSDDSWFSIMLRCTGTPTPTKVNEITVYFKIIVEDTLVQRAPTDQGGWNYGAPLTAEMRVGSKLKDDYSLQDTGVTYVETLTNYKTWDLSLDKYIKDRALYTKASQADNDYSAPITMSAAAVDKYWGIRSVSNFKIKSVSLAGADIFGNPADMAIFNPTGGSTDNGFSATAKLKLQLTTRKVELYLNDYGEGATKEERLRNFWSSPHDIQVNIALISDPDTVNYTICIPVMFVADNPQAMTLDTKAFNLNTRSKYTAEYNQGTVKYYNPKGEQVAYGDIDEETKNSVNKSGYNGLIVRPEDLIDYCSDGAPTTFYREGTTVGSPNGDFELQTLEGDNEDSPSAWRIFVHKNGQFTIKFRLRYESSGSSNKKNFDVSIFVVGYGNYSVEIAPIKGKKAVEYNVLIDSAFELLRNGSYQMTGVVSNNEEQLTATFRNNILTLEPRTDKISGTAKASITMTFTNVSGQTIEVVSNDIDININAGSFWDMFPDWQGWLIIAAAILGGILIILFIVWLFIHSISKHKQEENATAAPVSSYIVRLNSTIAATQAQQRLAATQALSQASSQMLLGAGPTGTQAPSPDTLQLATGVTGNNDATPPPEETSTPSTPAPTSEPEEKEENYDELIAEYISDEELLERIFTEKYEPKGMVRRTFFKSKDLQARELEKEKKRIIERYKTPMPMDEAIMSEAEIKKAEETAVSTPSTPEAAADTVENFILDFDPDAPLVAESSLRDEFSDEKIDLDMPPEESRLNDVEKQNELIQRELAELKSRMDKVQHELDKNKTREEELREKIAKAEADDEKFAKDIEDLEFKLATAKTKEKDRITRDIKTNERKMARNKDYIEKLRIELDALLNGEQKLDDIMGKLSDTQSQKLTAQTGIAANLDKARADYAAYQDRLAQVKARQEMEDKIQGITPMLEAVNNADFEMRALDSYMEKFEKERESLKADIAAAKAQILGANDFNIINDLNNRISDGNARLTEIEREITKSTKRRSDINVEFTSQRRKANDFVEKNEIPLEDLIAAEDIVVGNITLNNLREERSKDRELAEKAVAAAQATFEDVSASASDVTLIAMEVASNIQDLENELATTKSELDAINAQMETATDDEKLMLMVDQGDKSDKVEELTEKIKQANVEGTKRKIDAQAEYDEKLDAARRALDEATDEFKAATIKFDALTDTNPLDLIMSGCGIISQDQKKIEANNLKKQLEKSKNEIEQARLAAQMAQMEAEQAKVDADRASAEARAEAERSAQEAIEKAEAARAEAEAKARNDVEAAETARREAEEAAEAARRTAEETAEAVRREAEEAAETARREAEEAAEAARREAAETAEAARREAEETAEQARIEAENARREAAEAAERARREVEEAMQAETEEAKRRAQDEIDAMRRQAEEEAEAKRREEEARQAAENDRNNALAAKIAARKEKIVVVRERIKDVKNDDDAKNLREQLYTMQLSFDEDERGSIDLMDFYNKTMDDIQHAGEVATLKAENAKKPQRIVKKVTERVNRIPRKKAKPGARPAAGARRPAARPAAGARRPAARPGARPAAGARRPGPRPPRR